MNSRLMMRTAAVAAALVAGTVLAAPAAVAAPAAGQPISVEHPDGSYFRGTASFSNRSVTVEGTFRAVACKRLNVGAWAGTRRLDYKGTSRHCNSTTKEKFSLSADVRGGADRVSLELIPA